jgi:S-(hydroxymethyl)glutathione dehydrogenase/alcohol dehydrogenase
MKAALNREFGAGFVTEDIDIADPIGREVLVAVKASGLCQTDHSLASADFGFPLPVAHGHEVAGIVEAIGPDVKDLAVGDHVVACVVQSCGHCSACRDGRMVDCVNGSELERDAQQPPRLTQNGEKVSQVFGIGGFAEKILTHENQLAVVNNEIPFPQASLLGCGTVTGAGAVINSAQVRPGDTVAVFGTGGVGLNTISAAKLSGASVIIAVDILDSKLEMAKRFGATHTVNSKEVDAVEGIRNIVAGGVDFSFEVIGLPATQTQSVEAARVGGTAVLVGMGKPGASITIDTSIGNLLSHKTIKSVMMGSTNLKRDIPMFADLYRDGRLNLDDLVTQEIGIDDINQAYEDLKGGEIIRSVVTRF